jgi:hypothetical protein
VIGDAAVARDLLVSYAGEVVAVATEHRVLLAPWIAALEPDHPRRRFVAALVLVGRAMRTEPGFEPYDDDQAEFYARILLMPCNEFEPLAEELNDAELAECFNVPLEQVRAKRRDLDLDVLSDEGGSS